MTKPSDDQVRSSRRRFRYFRREGLGRVFRRGAPKRKAGDDATQDDDASSQRPTGSYRRYLRHYASWLYPYRWALGVIALLALVGVGFTTVKPLISAHIIDGAVLNDALDTEGKIARLFVWGWILVAVAVGGVAFDAARNYWMVVLNARVIHRVRQRLHDHLLRLPSDELSRMKSGGIVSRLSGDVDSAMTLVQAALISPSVAVVQGVVAIAILFSWNWRLAIATTAVVPIMVGVHLLWVRRIRPIYRSIRDDRAAVDGRVTETFGGIRVVRAFRREPKESADYGVGHHTAIRKLIFARMLELIVDSGWGLMMPAVSAVILWYGGYLVIQGEATVGQLFAFQWYVILVLGPILRLIHAMSQTQSALAAMERVFDILDKPPDKPDAPDAIEAPDHVGEIRFEDVTFAYRENLPVLRDINLTVPGGCVVALVGPSGAGKTTFTDLVARFQDPTEGAITLNNIDLRQLKLASYRRLLGVVQQDVFLFDGTVRDNIAYGRRHASEQEVLDAARRANAHVFIEELPEKYDTFIGERGVKLSGGQRQRLSIARAILADPRILILDEATSNLDTESEQLIQAALADLYANRTTFVIAHRLSTVSSADLIVVLDDGCIVEQGTHDELMRQRGMYYEMVQRQRQGYIDEIEASDEADRL